MIAISAHRMSVTSALRAEPDPLVFNFNFIKIILVVPGKTGGAKSASRIEVSRELLHISQRDA